MAFGVVASPASQDASAPWKRRKPKKPVPVTSSTTGVMRAATVQPNLRTTLLEMKSIRKMVAHPVAREKFAM